MTDIIFEGIFVTMQLDLMKRIVEGALMAAGEPLSVDRLQTLFPPELKPEAKEIRQIIQLLEQDFAERAIEIKEVSSGFRFQVRSDLAPYIGKLWEERPVRYSRALLETLALIAYRQPITRAEIEDVRGVAVSSHIIKILQDRDWVRVVGHKDVPGKPALFATTKQFLDYFGLKSLEQLPSLAEISQLDAIDPEKFLNGQLDLVVNEEAAAAAIAAQMEENIQAAAAEGIKVEALAVADEDGMLEAIDENEEMLEAFVKNKEDHDTLEDEENEMVEAVAEDDEDDTIETAETIKDKMLEVATE